MTPREALALLDEMVREASATRAKHKEIQDAVHLLYSIVVDNEKRQEVKSNE